ncbi:MAG: GTPase HflX, partial [Thermoanaerobaculia bacterium]|nr:GTPase HflX [Thermoanaerobaculia bacterium]
MRNPDTSGGALPSNKTENSKVILAGLFGRALPRAVSEDHLDELERLVDTAGGQVIARVLQERDTPDPATYLGRGKVREVAEQAGALSAGWIVVDDELTPSQVRNLEKELPARVLDRPAVILQIFAARA